MRGTPPDRGEHRRGRERALQTLLRESERQPHVWPREQVAEMWEELNARCRDELRAAVRDIFEELPANPTFVRFSDHATSPNGKGGARLKHPNTFDLEDPRAPYLRVLLPRLRRASFKNIS